MAFWSLLAVASMPVLQFLLIGLLGAFLASGYSNILSDNARRDINKVVFAVFTPAMVFVSLARKVTLGELITWWFMPLNCVIAFLIGGIIAWIMVKILRVEPHLENLVIVTCSAGNVGNMLLIIVPAICHEDGSPFGEGSFCHSRALSYVSLSMALGEIYVWTHSYSLIRKSAFLYDKFRNSDRSSGMLNKESEVSYAAHSLKTQTEHGCINKVVSFESSSKATDDVTKHEENWPTGIAMQISPLLSRDNLSERNMNFWEKFKGHLQRFIRELLAPPIIAVMLGLTTGVTPWLKSLIIGTTAPLRVIEDSAATLGHAMLACIPLLLGGNLAQGLHKSALKPVVIIMIISVRYIILPVIGIGVTEAASHLGFFPQDPLYRYVLLLQFTVPPATSISTMVQLFEAGKEECSVILLATYLVASFALTIWSTVFMWLLS